MENQMKISFITMDQFNRIWNKSMPQERNSAGITTLNFMSLKYNTLFIVGKQEDFIADATGIVPEMWLSAPVSIPLAPEIKTLQIGDRIDVSGGIARLVKE